MSGLSFNKNLMLANSVIKTSLLKKSALVLIFFFLSLQSYYFYNIGIAPFPLVSLIGIIIFSNKSRVPNEIKLYSFSLCILFIISSLWGFFFQLDLYYINSVVGIFLGAFILIFTTRFIKSFNIVLIYRVLAIVLIIHLICFWLQFGLYMLIGVNLDFLEFVTGEASRFEAYGAITGLIRATGVFNEPATYSYYIFTIVYLRFLCFKKINWFDQFSLISILFTLSLSGFFLYSFFQFYYWILYKGNINSIVFFSILIFVVFYIVQFIFEDTINLYLISRLSDAENDNSMNTRFSDGIIYFINLPINYVIFGLGIGNYTKNISTTASGWMSIITTFGIIPGSFFLFITFKYLRYLKVKLVSVIPLIILLFSTITPMQVIFWVVLSFFIVNNSNVKINA